MLDRIISAMGQPVTKRNSVFTPMLVLNFLVLIASIIVYSQDKNLAIFIPWLLVLIYSIYRYEKWAEKSPWLLGSQKVAIHGMDLFGDSSNPRSEKDIIDVEPISNPEIKKIKSGDDKK